VLFQQRPEIELPPSVSAARRQELNLFEKHAGVRFRNQRFLSLAFSHRSYANEAGSTIDNNEKLEFLGDSVLGLVICEYLYCEFPDKKEGDLARIKSFVVSESSLESIAKKLKVDNFILIGRGEEYSGGRSKTAIISDCMEAIIGAYYLDSGYKSVRSFILKHFVPEIDKVIEDKHRKDYKTLLQEYVQKQYKSYPKYILERKSGPDHDRTFWVSVKIEGKRYGPGKGKNKKEAEQEAAGVAFRSISNTD
jgi:ribonuclease-3